MANLSSRLLRGIILVLIAFAIVILIGSWTKYSIDFHYKNVPSGNAYQAMKETVTLLTNPDIADFYHGRTSRWKPTIAPPANSTCSYTHCNAVPELIAQPPTNAFECPHFSLDGTNPLVTIGVFSSAKGGPDELAKRNLWRLTSKEGIPFHLRHLVDVRFILGRSDDEGHEKDLDAEEAMYGDLLRLDGLEKGENMDDGKTYGYFRALFEDTEYHPSKRPVFVMKTDLDAFLVLPNVLDDFYSFSKMCATENAPAYWGGAWGSWVDVDVPPYFRGMGYAISYPLLAWIASTPRPLPYDSVKGIEDVRVGAWLWWLPDDTRLWIKDENWDAQDYGSGVIKYTTKVSIIHQLKDAQLWAEYGSRIQRAWDKAGRQYLWKPEPWQLDIITEGT